MVKKWRGQKATLTIKDSSDTEQPVGVLQDVEVAPSREISQLRGSNSIEWQDLQQTGLEINVSGEVMAWDKSTYDSLIDYDTTNEKITDTPEVPTFTVIVKHFTSDSTDSSEDSLTVTVKEVYFEELPISGSRDEWIGMSLDGTGKQIEKTETSPA